MLNPAGDFRESRERLYSDSEIVDLLERALKMGLNLGAGSDLEDLSVGELERLVTVLQ